MYFCSVCEGVVKGLGVCEGGMVEAEVVFVCTIEGIYLQNCIE